MIQTKIETKPGEYMMSSPEEIINYVESHFMDNLKSIDFNTVESDVKSLMDGAYPLLEYHQVGSGKFIYRIEGCSYNENEEHTIKLWVSLKHGVDVFTECLSLEDVCDIIDYTSPVLLAHSVKFV